MHYVRRREGWPLRRRRHRRASGQQPYVHVEYDTESGKPTMEVDFLVAKSNLQRRYNIVPIEVKSARF